MNEVQDAAILDQVEATIERFSRVRAEIGRAIFGQERVIDQPPSPGAAGGRLIVSTSFAPLVVSSA